MSFSPAVVSRLDIDDAVPDALCDLLDSDALDGVRRQDLDLSPEGPLKVSDEADEIVVRRVFELDEKIKVAAARLLATGVGAEQADALHGELSKRSLLLSEDAQYCSSCESFGWHGRHRQFHEAPK